MTNKYPSLRLAAATTLSAVLATSTASASGHFAVTVVDYHEGSSATLTNPYAAVGRPAAIVAAGSGFEAVNSPFNPHYESHQLAQIGGGGDLTLRLGRSVVVSPGTRHLGIFTNAGLIDGDWPNGINAGVFGVDSALIDVSGDGVNWVELGPVVCDFPSNGFGDAPAPYHPSAEGLSPSDFGKPHALELSDLDGKNHAQILGLLDGSAGGTWIDLTPSGLAVVSYVRLRVPVDGEPFELAAISINTDHAGPATAALAFSEDFATDPIGSRATSPTGHATHTGSALSAAFDLAASPARTAWPLGQELTDEMSFNYRVGLQIASIDFPGSSFAQLSFGLINASTTGNARTTSPSDAWDLVTVDYFPNEQFTTFAPTVIGSQGDGQADAFANLGFPSGDASLINDPGEIGALPVGTQLEVSVDYDAGSRVLTLRLDGMAINAFGSNPDGDETTIQYTVPERITFSVDTFAILCWQDATGGTADLTFTGIEVSTTGPGANYYSWADASITRALDRAPHLDADADGLSNLLDYALGGSRPNRTTAPGELRLQWRGIPARADVEVAAQSSPDLNAWKPAGDSVISAAAGIELHESSIDLLGDQRFLRLRATRP